MTGAVLALVLAANAGSPAPASGAGAERLLDEVVAVVRNPPSATPRVITLTKLEEEARIALVSRGATAAASGPLDRAALRAALEWLLDQTLVADEAARLRVDEVGREDVLGELRRFQRRFANPSDYARFLERAELTEEGLLATLARMLRVQRYVQSRVGRSARVDEDEVDRWLESRGAAGAPVAAREAARSQLAEERAGAQVRDLLAGLRARAEIRIVGHIRAAPGGGS